MTPTEFKSWFSVFIEAVDGTPTPKQWARIKAKVEELGGPCFENCEYVSFDGFYDARGRRVFTVSGNLGN